MRIRGTCVLCACLCVECACWMVARAHTHTFAARNSNTSRIVRAHKLYGDVTKVFKSENSQMNNLIISWSLSTCIVCECWKWVCLAFEFSDCSTVHCSLLCVCVFTLAIDAFVYICRCRMVNCVFLRVIVANEVKNTCAAFRFACCQRVYPADEVTKRTCRRYLEAKHSAVVFCRHRTPIAINPWWIFFVLLRRLCLPLVRTSALMRCCAAGAYRQ